MGTILSKEKDQLDLKKRIKEQGLLGIRQYLHLSSLNKDELRSLAVRLNATDDRIPRYSALTKEQLQQALLERGFSN